MNPNSAINLLWLTGQVALHTPLLICQLRGSRQKESRAPPFSQRPGLSQSNPSLCHFQLQEHQRHSYLGLRIPKFQASNLVLQGVRCSARTVSRLCDAAVTSPLVIDLLSKVFHHTQLCGVKCIHILKPLVKHLSNQHPENILIFTLTILHERAYFRAL